MATASTPTLPLSTPPPSSSPRRRLSKVLTGRRRSSDLQSDSGAAKIRASLESIGLSKSPNVHPHRSPSRDGSIRSSTSGGLKNLVPGHAKRERKRAREDEMDKIVIEEAARGRQPAASPDSVKRPDTLSRSHSSLVTVDSELESPPAVANQPSHAGYLTTTSPLITTTTVGETAPYGNNNDSTEQFPPIVEPLPLLSAPTSPKSPALQNIPSLPPLSGLVDKADTLRPVVDPTRTRSKSPGRRFKDVFSRSGKSPRVSPERKESVRTVTAAVTPPLSPPDTSSTGSDLHKVNTSFGERRASNNPTARGPSPLRSQTVPDLASTKPSVPALETETPVPRTPPDAVLFNPLTTITPPTPTDPESRSSFQASPRPEDSNKEGTEQHFSPAQNGHRRTQSQSSAVHQKSKLSTFMNAPLTPTIEETKTPSPSIGSASSRTASVGGSFFSSWASAAQNAANSITSLTNLNKSRTSLVPADASKTKAVDPPIKEETLLEEAEEEKAPQKELAVNTLGSGDLNLGHLGIDPSLEKRAPSPARSEYAPSVKDHVAAQMEDMLAKRAVSQAYERPAKSGEATPVAEIPDPVQSMRPASTFDTVTGSLTPPNGSVFEGETGQVKRSNSVRSKIHSRRSRGSSVTTAQSTIGAMVGASTATLANPATGPKLSGFAIAPKQRNRAFHQQFRSVPDDDFLIEDYSCALQKEILLAGRLYISEGHICFSSNILGWVTTLIISFEEVVSIEKENTAIVIPNAVAVQTLHARHTFRSLLSREATYDLMIGIWRVSHPDSFQKSMNGQKLAAGIVSSENVATNGDDGDAQASDSTTDDNSGSEDEDASEPSIGSSGSMAGDEFVETKSLSRKPSGGNNASSGPTVSASAAPAAGDAASAVLPVVAAADGAQDFPGPATHAPTDCTDSATHYDKVIKDEVVQAPLGKVYSLLYGPQSTAFLRKFLVDGVSKAQDLQLEDDKKGLDNETKTRKYQYIKPLGGSIGPKQTTCITTENLDSFDLEKAVSITCTTQTPDVPSGSAFSTKTRYCLTWAPGNATRFQMNMTIEWTAKSWLKGPIEKGALDGQTQYGDDLVKTLKGALGRARATTAGSKVLKNGKKKRKTTKKDKGDSVQAEAKKEENWGALEFARPILGPVVAPISPFVNMNVVVTILVIMVLWMWFRTPSATSLSRAGRMDRLSQYDELWRREESDLWEWLQDRAGVDGTIIRDSLKTQTAQDKDSRHKLKQRQKLLKSKDMQSRLREEKKSMKEMEEAVRVTQERLNSLQRALERQKTGQQ